MNFKSIKIFTLLLIIFLISVSAVSADDNATEIVASGDAGSFNDLQHIINNDGTGTINLESNYTYTNGDGVISISKDDLTVNGNGAIIDANGSNRIFSISGSNVVLNNLTIINANVSGINLGIISLPSYAIQWTGSGGVLANSTVKDNHVSSSLCAVMQWTGDNATIDNCIIENNKAPFLGQTGISGAVYLSGGYSKVSNSIFANNSGLYGGAIYIAGENINVFNSSFVNNSAWYGGALYSNSPNTKVSKSYFKENNATFTGGAIYWYSQDENGVITTSIFADNTGTSGSAIAIGSNTQLTLENSVFINNDLEDANVVNATASTASAMANTNWWGNTVDDLTTAPKVYGNVTVDDWLFLNVTANPTDIYAGKNSTINFDLTHTSDAEGNVKNIGLYNLYPSDIIVNDVVGGSVNATNLVFDSGIANVFYQAEDGGNGFLSVNILGLVYDFDFTIKTLTLEISIDDIYVGQNATLRISLPNDATGSINIYINDKFLSNVSASTKTLTIENLTAGNYTVKAIYAGDQSCPASNDTATFKVKEKISDYDFNITCGDIIEGETAIIIVSLPLDASGTVLITINHNAYYKRLANGTTSINISNLAIGKYPIAVSYSGDDKYESGVANSTFSVNKNKENVTLVANDVVLYYKNGTRFYILLTDSNSNPINNATVKITINGVEYSKTTENGSTSIPLNLNSGTYITSVVFEGDDDYNSASLNATVNILSTVSGEDITKVYKNGTQFYATFLDGQGNKLAKGTEVTFNINGVMYKRTTDENGVAGLTINLNPGNYIITSINPSTGENTANNVTVLPSIVNNHDLTKYFRNGSQFSALILGVDGNPVGAGAEVTFNINGIFYTKTTNDDGYVTLNINLNPGSYIMTTEYNGLKASNNITVLPILSGDDITMKYRDGTQYKATLLDGQGNPYPNQNVTFNINGVFYTRTTDENGVANLNINLIPGSYIITARCGYASYSNTITING